MAEIKAQSISETVKKKLDPKKESEMLAAKICYYYSHYSLQEALSLPYKDVRLLLKVAEREKAEKNFILTQIAAAPYTKDGSALKTLSEKFKAIMDS